MRDRTSFWSPSDALRRYLGSENLCGVHGLCSRPPVRPFLPMMPFPYRIAPPVCLTTDRSGYCTSGDWRRA
jgi:hypothetical protein